MAVLQGQLPLQALFGWTVGLLEEGRKRNWKPEPLRPCSPHVTGEGRSRSPRRSFSSIPCWPGKSEELQIDASWGTGETRGTPAPCKNTRRNKKCTKMDLIGGHLYTVHALAGWSVVPRVICALCTRFTWGSIGHLYTHCAHTWWVIWTHTVLERVISTCINGWGRLNVLQCPIPGSEVGTCVFLGVTWVAGDKALTLAVTWTFSIF